MLIRYGKEENGKLIKKAVVYTQDEHRINTADVDKDAVFITSKLRSNGYQGYIVGGAVRDLLLKKKPKDFDIVTDATPAKIKRVFYNSRIIGKRFRLVHVYFGPRIFEVSTFRSLKDGHTGNTYGTMEEDVLRRDFSCNALFYDPGKQIVVDYVNGMDDIRKRQLRPIIPLSVIFNDDPVRMIRAVKYAAAGGFSVPWSLKQRIKKEAHLLSGVSASRLTEELSKIIRSPAAALIVKNLEEAGLYRYLQKEASALMKTNPAFCAAYLKSLGGGAGSGALDSAAPDNAATPPPPQKQTPPRTAQTAPPVIAPPPVIALVRDYLELKVSWEDIKKGSWDDCRAVFFDARRFIFPMNPPKIELDKAIRALFSEHGIEIKKTRLYERERKRPPTGDTPRPRHTRKEILKER
jgi:poly(A) polymerase